MPRPPPSPGLGRWPKRDQALELCTCLLLQSITSYTFFHMDKSWSISTTGAVLMGQGMMVPLCYNIICRTPAQLVRLSMPNVKPCFWLWFVLLFRQAAVTLRIRVLLCPRLLTCSLSFRKPAWVLQVTMPFVWLCRRPYSLFCSRRVSAQSASRRHPMIHTPERSEPTQVSQQRHGVLHVPYHSLRFNGEPTWRALLMQGP